MSMKNAYVAKMEAQLKEWSGELSTFKARAEKAVAEGRIGYEQKLTASKAQHDVAAKKLEELKAAGESQWEALKAGVESAWGQLKTSMDSARN